MMIPPPSPPPPLPNANAAAAAVAAGGGNDDEAVTAPLTDDVEGAAVWRQRRVSLMDQEQQRQRSLRTLMTFLMMLLLMEGEEPPHHPSNNSNKKRKGLRGKSSRMGGGRDDDSSNGNLLDGGALNASSSVLQRRRGTLELEVFEARMGQDRALQQMSHSHPGYHHPRYLNLIDKNQGVDVAKQVEEWSRLRAEQQKDEFFAASAGATAAAGESARSAGGAVASVSAAESQPPPTLDKLTEADEAEGKRHVLHYPWNSTGFYRGTWTRHNATVSAAEPSASKSVLDELLMTTTHRNGPGIVEVLSSNVSSSLLLSYRVQDPTRLEPHVSRILASTSASRVPSFLTSSRRDGGGDGGSGSGAGAGAGAGGDGVRVVILPPHLLLPVRDDHNLTAREWERMTTDSSGRVYPPPPPPAEPQASSAATSTTMKAAASASSASTADPPDPQHQITLSRDDGRVAFQLFSRPIPGMKEISLVDGFVKLYDSVHAGYSTRKDLLLRVRGVHIHSIGRLSLVSSNVDVRRTALLIEPPVGASGGAAPQPNAKEATGRGRRLLEQLLQDAEPDVDAIRKAALDASPAAKAATQGVEPTSVLQSTESLDRQEGAKAVSNPTVESDVLPESKSRSAGASKAKEAPVTPSKGPLTTPSITEALPVWSNYVVPYPFIRDDADESIRKERTPAYRKMPPREQALEANAASCEFEINLDVQPTQWTIGSWRNLVLRRLKEQRRLDPSQPIPPEDEVSTSSETIPGPTALKERTAHIRSVVAGRHSKSKKKSALQDQALVMTLVGTIHSSNCAFTASLNATALRTDWDKTTSKAVNYSFYMMLVCLAQILVLLRQLLHSQSTSAATRVSLLCVGWQTVLDALLCLAHIYLSLAMQPLFTAFASVAFFKLLIFCVIEMKVRCALVPL
jgi:hypothetical protein